MPAATQEKRVLCVHFNSFCSFFWIIFLFLPFHPHPPVLYLSISLVLLNIFKPLRIVSLNHTFYICNRLLPVLVLCISVESFFLFFLYFSFFLKFKCYIFNLLFFYIYSFVCFSYCSLLLAVNLYINLLYPILFNLAFLSFLFFSHHIC